MEWVKTQDYPLTPPAKEDPFLGFWQRRLVEATALIARDALVRMGKEMPSVLQAPEIMGHPDACIQLACTSPSSLKDSSQDPRENEKGVTLSLSLPSSVVVCRGENSGSAVYVHVSAPPHTLGLPDPVLKAALDGTLFDAINTHACGMFVIPLDEDIAGCVNQYLDEGSVWHGEFMEKKMDLALPTPVPGTGPTLSRI